MHYTDKGCVEEYLCLHADEHPDQTAIIVKGIHTSYGQLWRLVRGFSRYLTTQCGIRKGDRIVVKATQTLSYAISYFAVHLSGAVFVPLEKNLPADKCLSILKEVEGKIYIAAAKAFEDNVPYISSREVEPLAETYFDEEMLVTFPDSEDSADIMYTTGTTGKAKGVEVVHRVLLALSENYIEGFEFRPDTVIVVPGPMNHVNPLRKLYVSIVNGSTIVILNGMVSMKTFYDALDHGANALCLPPASLRVLWQVSGDKLAEYSDRIDFVECSTSPLTESDKITLRRQLPNSRLYNNYGLSECGAMVMYDFNAWPEKADGCVGKPAVNSHVVIMNEKRKEIISSKDNPGLIANAGPINMKGYWREPELTAEVMDDTYVYTKDIGYFDEDGFLHVIGRRNDNINVGGLKVAPTEVEDAAQTMEEICDCICVPVNDEITGSALKLFVVPANGCEVDEVRIKKYLSGRLESYMVPKYVEKIEEVPRNWVGKPDRNAFENGRRKEMKRR